MFLPITPFSDVFDEFPKKENVNMTFSLDLFLVNPSLFSRLGFSNPLLSLFGGGPVFCLGGCCGC
jgi:hypothetical protein